MYAEGLVMQQLQSLVVADAVAVGALLTAVVLLVRFHDLLACILCWVAVLLPRFSVVFSV